MTTLDNNSANQIFSPLDSDRRAKLNTFLKTRFSLAELETLAFDLGLNKDVVRHQTIGEFAIDVIDYFEKRKELAALLNKVVATRPDAEIADILERVVRWYSDKAELRAKSPYQGLSAFTKEQAVYFCGREEFTAKLLAKVNAEPLVAEVLPLAQMVKYLQVAVTIKALFCGT